MPDLYLQPRTLQCNEQEGMHLTLARNRAGRWTAALVDVTGATDETVGGLPADTAQGALDSLETTLRVEALR